MSFHVKQTSRIPFYTHCRLHQGSWLVLHPLELKLDKALFGWNSVNPPKAECNAHLALDLLHANYGVAKTYTPDNAMTKVNQVGSTIHPIEAHTPNPK